MYTLKINKDETKKLYVQATGEDLISVAFDIFDGKEIIQSMAHGFPLDATKEEIDAALEKVLATFTSDMVRQEELEEVAALHEQADSTIDELVGNKKIKNK